MKKITAICTMIIMLIVTYPSINEVSAENSITGTYGDLSYEIYGGEARITGCNNKDIMSVTIPSDIQGYPVTTLQDYLFEGCKKLTYVNFSDGIDNVGNRMFINCTSLKTVIIPNSVKEIGVAAFWGCISLEDLTIPQSVKTISMGAFVGCKSLKELNLPAVEEHTFDFLGGAFINCVSLKDINVAPGGSYRSVNGVLFNEDMTALLAYPAGKTDTYYYSSTKASIVAPPIL